MTTISQPKVTVNKLPADVPQGLDAQKILVIGQKVAAGGAVAGALQEGVQKSEVKSFYGEGSMLQEMLNSIYDVFDRSGSLKLPKVDVIPLDDAGAGVAASGTIVIAEVGGATGLASETGKMKVIVGSKFNYTFELAITKGESIAGIGARLEALVDAVTKCPVVASESTNTVTFTANNKGTFGNAINLRMTGLLKSGSDYIVGNVGFTLTGMASGATDPTLPTVGTVVGDNRYQTVVHPVQYGTAFTVDNFLDGRFNTDNNILDGVAVVKDNDTLANLKTALGSLNSENLVYLCDKTVSEDTYKGSAIIEFDFVVSARVAAIRALRLTEGANISRMTVASSRGPLDALGGAHIASLPYFNSTLDAVSPLDAGKGFTLTEIEELFDEGGSVIGNNVVGNTVIFGEMVTTYLTDGAGSTDKTWQFLNARDTMSVAAEYIFNNLKSDFAQSRLTEGDVVAGHAMVNVEAMKGQLKKYYLDLAALALVPSGSASVKFFLDNLTVVFDVLKGKATINSNLPIVVQLREILVNLKTEFSIN